MSAYGAIVNTAPSKILSSTSWTTKPGSTPAYLTLHHLDFSRASNLSGLLDCLHAAFAQIIEEGATYPQEVSSGEAYTRASFDAYFLSAAVIVAISGDGNRPPISASGTVHEVELDVNTARNGRSWDECVVGFYYVKPNYPGRSSHICNGGFVVPVSHRGNGYGTVLAKSYLHYAPALGYQASVFNLVYVNNEASVRLWERLGFHKAGRIPRAGRLRRKDGQGEEYVDAWVIYKSFVDDNDTPSTL